VPPCIAQCRSGGNLGRRMPEISRVGRGVSGRRLVAALVAALVVIPAVAATAEVTRQQLSEARSRVNAKQSDVDRELAALDAILVQQANTEARLARIETEIANRDRQIVLASFAAKEQAWAMYVSAGAGSVAVAVTADTIGTLGARNAYLEALVDHEVDRVTELLFLQEDRARLTVELEHLREELEVMGEEVRQIYEVLLAELEEVNTEYRTLLTQWEREERARQIRRAQEEARRTGFFSSAHVDPRGRTCPIPPGYGNTFRDSWREPRPYRNGVHLGTDLIAAEGTPLVAMENGTVIWGSPSWHWAGGNQIYLRGDSGDVYYYAHLQRFAPGITTGSRVGVAQLVGYVGNTGVSSIPHLHLGFQPGGGPLTNPYQLLLRLCR
jgi:peptidoglycan LD-endopeptidase LytH